MKKSIKSDNMSVRTPTAPMVPKTPDNPISPSGKDLNMPKIDWPKSVEIKTTADERMNDMFDRISNKPTDLELLGILETFAFSVKDTLNGTNFVLTQSPEKIKDIIIRLDNFKSSDYFNELTPSQRRNALNAIDEIEKILHSENLNQSKKTIKSSISAASLKEKLDGKFWTSAEDFEEELNEVGWDVDDINREYATISNESGSQYEVKFVDTGDNGSLSIESFELVYRDEDDDDDEIESSRKSIKSASPAIASNVDVASWRREKADRLIEEANEIDPSYSFVEYDIGPKKEIKYKIFKNNNKYVGTFDVFTDPPYNSPYRYFFNHVNVGNLEFQGMNIDEFNKDFNDFIRLDKKVDSSHKSEASAWVKNAIKKDHLFDNISKLCSDLKAYPEDKLPPNGLYCKLISCKMELDGSSKLEAEKMCSSFTILNWVDHLNDLLKNF